jgi:hypothetical protein
MERERSKFLRSSRSACTAFVHELGARETIHCVYLTFVNTINHKINVFLLPPTARMPRPESDFTTEDILSMSLPTGLDGSTSLPGTLERRKKSKGGSEEPEDGTDGSMPSKPLMRGTR